MQHAFMAILRHQHGSLDDRNTRSFEPAVHAENGAGNGYAAIARGDIEVAGVALGGLDDDGAAIQTDGHIVAAFGDGEARALAHLDVRAIAETEYGVRIAGGADI